MSDPSSTISTKRTPRRSLKKLLARIAALYGIEKQIRGLPPDQRQQVRQERAQPLLQCFHIWLKESVAKLFRKSDVAVAIHYALAVGPVIPYSNDGRLEIDNNAAERALRALAIGRTNYLFTGSDAGGESGGCDELDRRTLALERRPSKNQHNIRERLTQPSLCPRPAGCGHDRLSYVSNGSLNAYGPLINTS